MVDGYEDSSDSDHDHRSHRETRRDGSQLLNSIRQRKARKIAGHIKSRELHDVWQQGNAIAVGFIAIYLVVMGDNPLRVPEFQFRASYQL